MIDSAQTFIRRAGVGQESSVGALARELATRPGEAHAHFLEIAADGAQAERRVSTLE